MLTELRLEQLADNIRQDLNLLKEYEDKLRYETDPRRLAGYRREIERQRESMTRYQQEYDELQKQVTGVPSAEMVDTANLLPQMDAKLDNVQRRLEDIDDKLNALRKTLLARFDASEQAIISAIVQRLDQNQLAIVQSIVDEIDANRAPESELQETLDAVQQALSEIKEKEAILHDPQLVREVENLSAVVDDPKLEVSHKLKVSIPIIPLILSYDIEVGLKSGLNLKATWQHLKARVRSAR